MSKSEFIKICRDQKFWQWIRHRSPTTYPSIADNFQIFSGNERKFRISL